MMAVTIKTQARINDVSNYMDKRNMIGVFKYSKNRKFISLFLVIMSRKRGPRVEYRSLHNDLVNI